MLLKNNLYEIIFCCTCDKKLIILFLIGFKSDNYIVYIYINIPLKTLHFFKNKFIIR